ncbi:hypothetical protein A2U01_0046480, partial [Trifolium medium]|nr:hypothetical protein [Trifolium medium]
RILDINRRIGKELGVPFSATLKLKQDLFLSNFGEVKFGFIKGLENLVNTELGWPLFEVTTLVQLSNETMLTGNHLSPK